MRDALLIVHIIAVSLWLGGSVMNGLLNAKLAAAGTVEANAYLARAETKLGMQFYMPMGVLTLLTGVGLVLDSDTYSFSDPFVSMGFLAIIVAAALGPLKFEPLSEKIASAYEAGDATAAQESTKQIAMWSAIDTLLIVVALAMMVLKTGA